MYQEFDETAQLLILEFPMLSFKEFKGKIREIHSTEIAPGDILCLALKYGIIKR